MSELKYTLVSDGSSDTMLLSVLDWVLEQCSARLFIGRWAELRHLRCAPKGLAERVRTAIDLYPCDLLFVHRDAERTDRKKRASEIERELVAADVPRWVPVVPVRMQEAWFLFEEHALRKAAGNPAGDEPLDVPVLSRTEGIPNPKRVLENLLRKASGFKGRRLEKLRVEPMKHRVAKLISDFSPLRALPAFKELETNVGRVVVTHRWT